MKKIYDHLHDKKKLSDEEKLAALNELKLEGEKGLDGYLHANKALLMAMRKNDINVARVLISIGVRKIKIDYSISPPSDLSDTENLIRCYIVPQKPIPGGDDGVIDTVGEMATMGFFAGFILGPMLGLFLPNLMPLAIAMSLPFIGIVVGWFVANIYINIKTPSYESRLNYCKEKNIITVDEYNKLSKNDALHVDVHRNEPKSTSNAPTQASISAKNGGSKNKEESRLSKK